MVLLFVALQQLEGHFVAPQVFRISLRINPILIILALLIGYQLYGIAGALIALPVIAVLRQTVLYLRKHMVLGDGFTRDTVYFSVLRDEWPAVEAGLLARLSPLTARPPGA